MQLANDIFDVYKDRENAIKTLVTETNRINNLRNLFKSKLTAGLTVAYTSGFHKRNLTKFLSLLSLGIFSRAMVCLDHLEQNESTTGNKFSIHRYKREDLICDMDTKKNMLRSAAHHIQILSS